MRTILTVLTLALVLPSGAFAQDELGISFSGGLTLTAGDESETYGTGLNFGAKTIFPISQRLSLQASIGYQDLRLQFERAAADRGHDPSTFRLGGGFIDGGTRRALGVMAQAQLHLLPRSDRFSPYVVAGAGLSQVRVTDLTLYFLGEYEDEPGSSEIALGGEVGAGVQVRLAGTVSAFAQGSYQSLFTEGGSTTMIPVQVGLVFLLGSN